MMIQGNETMQPEELTQLGAVFDEVWAELCDTAGHEDAELRTALASVLLRLANLKQLGADEMKSTALRILRCEPNQQLQSDAEIDCPSGRAEEREAAVPSVSQGA